MLNPGTYTAKPIQAVLAKTSTGKEQVAVEFELIEEDVRGQRITWYGFFTEGTFDSTIEGLRACGWEGDDLSDLSSVNGSVEASLVVEHEEYQGNVKARVRWVNKAGGVAVKDRIPDDEAKRFAARMRGRISAGVVKSGGGGKPAAPSKPQRPDDDIPFAHEPYVDVPTEKWIERRM